MCSSVRAVKFYVDNSIKVVTGIDHAHPRQRTASDHLSALPDMLSAGQCLAKDMRCLRRGIANAPIEGMRAGADDVGAQTRLAIAGIARPLLRPSHERLADPLPPALLIDHQPPNLGARIVLERQHAADIDPAGDRAAHLANKEGTLIIRDNGAVSLGDGFECG